MLKPFVDAHVHLNTTSPAKMELALKKGVSFLSINADIPFFRNIKEQEQAVLNLQKAYPGKVLHVTTFDNKFWNTDQWLTNVMDQIKKGIDKGAVGIKIWKNFGLDKSLKDTDGNFVMVDDQRLDPIYEYATAHNLLLLGHQGEPRNCWLPLEEMTVLSDKQYFSQHPEYHMCQNTQFPSYEKQMAARDRMLRKHPDLKFVGLHLFSLEWSLDEVAKRLDDFPNTMTDLAERISHVQLQAKEHYERVRDFFIQYQDRIMYGTDVIDDGTLTDLALIQKFETLWESHWNFFATNKEMTVPDFDGVFKGLALPDAVLEKLFLKNAVKTYGFSLNQH